MHSKVGPAPEQLSQNLCTWGPSTGIFLETLQVVLIYKHCLITIGLLCICVFIFIPDCKHTSIPGSIVYILIFARFLNFSDICYMHEI